MDIENTIRAIQRESEASKDLPLPDNAVGERRGKSVVRSVRLPEAEYEEIEQLAEKAGRACQRVASRLGVAGIG